MTEEQLQAECFKWHWNTFPEFRRCLFHVPNGGLRNPREAAKFKAVGVVAGVSDFIYLLEGRYYCFELKTISGRLSNEQKKFEQAIGEDNYFVVRSLNAFKDLITQIHKKKAVN